MQLYSPIISLQLFAVTIYLWNPRATEYWSCSRFSYSYTLFQLGKMFPSSKGKNCYIKLWR